jgi:beta-galactosidase
VFALSPKAQLNMVVICYFNSRGATTMSDPGAANCENNDPIFTRREALQGLAGVAASTILPVSALAEKAKKHAPAAWPEDAVKKCAAASFTSDWRFHRGDAQGAESVDFDDSGWRTLDVPHDWSIEDLPDSAPEGMGAVWSQGTPPLRTGPFDAYASEGQTATGWMVGGIGWYRKSFDKPDFRPDGKVELRFDGVYMNSDVWINGASLGNHPYGYTPFAYDLTPHLKDGSNVVAVKVNNTGRNSRWYSGSGIFRKVWLSVAGDLRIPQYGVSVTTPQVAQDAATVNVDVTVENGAAANRKGTVRVRLIDPTGNAAGESSAPIAVSANSSATGSCSLNVATPKLWSPAEPNLYRAEIVVEAAGKTADARALNVGIRKIEINAAQGLRVNGEPYKLQGGCVHHDNGVLGSACIPRAEERRVETLKANGYNAIRTSHNPPSPDFLDACDRLGMLVVDEAFDCWEKGKNPQDYHLYFKDWWKRDLQAMIMRDRNDPSVVVWSIGNEIPERATPQGVETGKALQDAVHWLDPTRPVTAAVNQARDYPGETWQAMEPAFTYLDVGGYNYEYAEYEPDHTKYPDRVMMGTESFPNQVFQNWQVIEKNPYVLGDFVWTAIDYLGESGIGHASISLGQAHDVFTPPYPWFNSYCGDIDLIGNKKPQSYFRDVVWRRSKVEMAAQRPVPDRWSESVSRWGWSDELRSWTWPGLEGTPLKVRVYTRGDKVTLLLNGKEVESKPLSETDALTTEFSVPYAPGELKAIAYQGGNEIGNITFTTAGKPTKLVLRPDRSSLKPTRDDLSYIMVQVVDEAGRLVPDAVIPVSFTVSGAGELVATGSADPKDVSSFRQPRHNTYHGECVFVVRPTGKPGSVEVSANSPGLQGASLTLDVSA